MKKFFTALLATFLLTIGVAHAQVTTFTPWKLSGTDISPKRDTWSVTVPGTLNAGILNVTIKVVAGTTVFDSNVYFNHGFTGSGAIVTIGTGATTSHGLSAVDDVLIGGSLEVQDDSWIDALLTSSEFTVTNTAYLQGDTYTNGVFGTGTTAVTVGSGVTSHSLSNRDDLLVSGKSEFDGFTYFDSSMFLATSKSFFVGGATSDGGLLDISDNLHLFTPSSNNVLLTTNENRGVSHGLANSNNPTLLIYSAVRTGNQYAKLYMSGTGAHTNFNVDTLTGSIVLDAYTDTVLLESSTGASLIFNLISGSARAARIYKNWNSPYNMNFYNATNNANAPMYFFTDDGTDGPVITLLNKYTGIGYVNNPLRDLHIGSGGIANTNTFVTATNSKNLLIEGVDGYIETLSLNDGTYAGGIGMTTMTTTGAVVSKWFFIPKVSDNSLNLTYGTDRLAFSNPSVVQFNADRTVRFPNTTYGSGSVIFDGRVQAGTGVFLYNVAVGTGSVKNSNLHVYDASSYVAFRLEAQGDYSSSNQFYSNGIQKGVMGYYSTGDSIKIGHAEAGTSLVDNHLVVKEGNVIVGTGSTTSKFHVSSSAITTVTIDSSVSTGDVILQLVDGTKSTTEGLKIWHDSSDGDEYFDNMFNDSAGDIYFRTRTSGTPVNVLSLLGSGKVAVNTGATINNNELYVYGSGATAGNFDVGGDLKVGSVYNAIGALNPMAIIGTSSNSIQTLHLENSSAGIAAEMRFVAQANDGSYLFFTQPSSGNTGTWFGETKSTGSFLASTERNLVIGTLGDGDDILLGTGNDEIVMTIEDGAGANVLTIGSGAVITMSGSTVTTGIHYQSGAILSTEDISTTKGIQCTPYTPSDFTGSGAYTIDIYNYCGTQLFTVSGDTTFTFSGATLGDAYTIELTQAATSTGAISFTNCKYFNGSGSYQTDNNDVDLVTGKYISNYYCSIGNSK